MVTVSAVLGAVLAWTLVVTMATGAGYGLVHAWGRYGTRLPLPERARPLVERLLGPVAAPSTQPGAAAAQNAPATMGATEPGPLAAEGTSAVASVAALSAGDDVAIATGNASDALGSSGAAPPEATASASSAEPALEVHAPASSLSTEQTGVEAADGAAVDAPPAAAPSDSSETATEAKNRPAESRPVRMLARADAIAEISGIFSVDYEAAVALLESGLWGLENFDEWSRSMRGGTPPEGIENAVFERVVQASMGALKEPVADFRRKLAATRALEELWGVGPNEAEALFDAGFRDTASIRKAPTDKLAKVPGIGMALAFQIRASAHGLAPTA